MKRVMIAPSLLAADFARLADEIRKVEDAGADWLHLDVMDNHFVPNLTIGPPLVECVRRATKLPLDVHLMLTHPERLVGAFIDAGADGVTVHAEALAYDHSRREHERGFVLAPGSREPIDEERLARALEPIRRAGKSAGIAINPDTPAEAIDGVAGRFDLILAMTVWPGFGGQKFIDAVAPKVAALRERWPDKDIEVDGGINAETVRRVRAANVIVAGTATFRSADPAAAIAGLRGGG